VDGVFISFPFSQTIGVMIFFFPEALGPRGILKQEDSLVVVFPSLGPQQAVQTFDLLPSSVNLFVSSRGFFLSEQRLLQFLRGSCAQEIVESYLSSPRISSLFRRERRRLFLKFKRPSRRPATRNKNRVPSRNS